MKGRISIVMPTYNEETLIERSIADIKKQFEALSQDYEIIVVDDGSSDGTRMIIDKLTDQTIKVVGYDKNKGKGSALKSGLYCATGEFAFLVDSDSEICTNDLVNYIKSLESADIVIGSKRHPLSIVQAPTIRKFLSLGFNILERLLTGIRVGDTQAGLKAARSAALYKILPLLAVKRYAFDAELLTVASILNFEIKEMPVLVNLSARFGTKQVIRMLIDLLGIAYRLRIRRWYQENISRMSGTYKPVIPW